MKKICYSVILGLSALYAGNAKGQCPAGRYMTDMFPSAMSTVTYSTPYNLQMDIYQPAGDTYAARPLIILGHGGSFIGGTRSDDVTVDSLCVRFARRGYVTASIDYRLSTIGALASPDSTVPIDIVIKAISDGKAAIRYFVKDAATTNTYKIDTNNIFIGGNSAGAVLYMHVGYLSESECPPAIATAMAANGGFEGNSGNAGYTTKHRAVINLAGALNLTSIIDPTDIPSVNVQGSADATVPYNCAHPLSGLVQVNLCGLGQLEPAYTASSVNHWSKVYMGDAHVPWASTPSKFKTVDSLVKEFLYTIVCPTGAAVRNITSGTEMLMYPNPASNSVTITSDASVNEIAVYDQLGRTAFSAAGLGKNEVEINTGHFAAGVYFVRIKFADENIPMTVRRLIVE